MKNAIKVSVCILLAVILVFTSSLATFCFIKDSVYIYDLKNKKYYSAEQHEQYKLWNYFDKVPKGLSYDGVEAAELDQILQRANKNHIARVTFTEKISGKSIRTEFVFDVNEILLGGYQSNTVSLRFGTDIPSYYSSFEHMLYYHGAEYERGHEYLLFFETDEQGKTYPLGTFDKQNLTHLRYCIAPLDGEYPYIEVYPGTTRYDATHFGAESKHVTADEFAKLVINAISEAES